MATNFTTLASTAKKKEKGKTVFEKFLEKDLTVAKAELTANRWDNVMFLYTDKYYGDVFLAWDNNKPNDRTIYFGRKGDEFDEQ